MCNRGPDRRRTIFRLAVAACFVISAASALATSSFMNSCVNNMRQIDSALQQWALENGIKDTNSCSLFYIQILAYFKGKELPRCPEGGTYTAGPVLTNEPACSIHGTIETAVSIQQRRNQAAERKAILRTVSVLIASAGCIGGWLLFRREWLRRHPEF